MLLLPAEAVNVSRKGEFTLKLAALKARKRLLQHGINECRRESCGQFDPRSSYTARFIATPWTVGFICEAECLATRCI